MAITLVEWLGGLLVIVLLIAALVALVRLLVPKLTIGKSRALKIALVVFALLGAVAVSSAGSMMLMHLSMMGCCQGQ